MPKKISTLIPDNGHQHFNTIDICGMRFGRLTVLKIAGTSNGREKIWQCVCDCGNVVMRLGTSLRSGKSTHCGIHQSNEHRRTASVHKRKLGTLERNVFRQYKYSVNHRRGGLAFDLTIEQFRLLIYGNCFYCECAPSMIKKTKFETAQMNGIDRIDNSIGYLMDNCVPCCTLCNFMKRGLSVASFLDHVKKIAIIHERKSIARP